LILQLSEGRKQVGGKLEVKIRIRDPFKGKQVEETKEKWLVIDQFIRALGPKVKHMCTKEKFKANIFFFIFQLCKCFFVKEDNVNIYAFICLNLKHFNTNIKPFYLFN
jgi:hypothetical protein